MKKQSYLCLLLASVLTVPTGCITVKESEERSLNGEDLNGAKRRVARGCGLEVEHYIYKSPDAPQSPALQSLLDMGVVPVYVKVTNTSDAPVSPEQATIVVRDKLGRLRPVSPHSLPEHFSSFNRDALFANIFNVTLVVGGTLLLIYAVAKDGASGGWCGGIRTNEWSAQEYEERNGRMINPLTKHTYINYENAVMHDGVIEPRESLEGLMFFQAAGRQPSWQTLKLKVESPRR